MVSDALVFPKKVEYTTQRTHVKPLSCDFARVDNVTFYMSCVGNDEKAS